MAAGTNSALDTANSLQQTSLRRIKEFAIKPKRDLGQNFLIDDNILQVILGQLECQATDVALEVDAGLRILTLAFCGIG